MTRILSALKNQLRTWLGIRRPRRVGPPNAKPAVGRSIIRGRLRMRVTVVLTSEQWMWLTLLGWRVQNFADDRRRYLHLPRDTLTQLLRAGPSGRDAYHQQVLRALRPKSEAQRARAS